MTKFLLSAILIFAFCIPAEAKLFHGKRAGKVRDRVSRVIHKRTKSGKRAPSHKAKVCPCGPTCPKSACGCGCK